QAEDGIRDRNVTGVQTCALPIFGTEHFMAGIRSYFTEHAWSNTEFSDLLRHLEAASGRDLAGWSEQWLHSTGVNTLTWRRQDDNLVITQSQAVRQHRVGIGFYDVVDQRLIRTHFTEIDLKSDVTTIRLQDVPLIVVNDG